MKEKTTPEEINENTELSEEKHSITLVDVIITAIKIPGVKVNRNSFLHDQFKDESKEKLREIIEVGPVEAGCDRKQLRKIARKLIKERTLFSTGASFVTGLPGGFAMAAAIPADIAQFYGVALKLAQELSYIYGEPDLWEGNKPDSEKVTNQLILYCGVMLGASGAAQTVRVLSSSLAKQIAKKLPQKALTKTFYYPIVKSIAKAFGAKMTKEVFAKGVSKAVPVIGGVVSGGITLATLSPMGKRLADTLDSAHFDYTEDDFEADWNDIAEESKKAEEAPDTSVEVIDITEEVSEESTTDQSSEEGNISTADLFEEINKAKQLLDAGMITEDEFTKIKSKLIDRL